jgi:hypothetical protein
LAAGEALLSHQNRTHHIGLLRPPEGTLLHAQYEA